MLKPIPLTRELELPATPEELWPHVSNTNRLNKAAGIPAMTRGPSAGEYARRVEISVLGFPVAFTERPFEWVEGRFFNVVRDFDGGPIARFSGGMKLEPSGSGTKLTLVSEITPRNALGDLLVRWIAGKKALDDAEAVVREIAAKLSAGESHACYPTRRTRTEPDAEALLRRGLTLRASACDKKIVERLLDYLEKAYDDELASIRPFELADSWGFDRLRTLETLLHAVKAGLLDLRWHVICPNCTNGPGVGGLGQLKAKAHCDSCNIEFGADLEESVELRLTAAPAVRPLQPLLYCVGSPAHSRFAAAQFSVPKGGRAVELILGSESYTVRDLCGRRTIALRPAADGPSETAVAFGGAPVRFKPGRVRLTLPGECESALVRVEREAWKEKAAKACVVTSLQDFRDLFSSEVLAAGTEVSVRSIALLFTDLKGSTALYEKVGDATAYAIVRDHFDYLFEIVKRRRGAVVKTIGDAVMACFASPADALDAAFEMQERVTELNKRLDPRPAVTLKVGVHQGPAIAINSNEVLDYFGTTVNVAARVQNESVGGDVVVTEAVCGDPGARRVLDAHTWDCEPFKIQLKGLSELFCLRRLTPKADA